MPILANVIENAFSPLISLFEGIMVAIHNHIVGGSWGLAIVGLTVLIRAILVPLTFRQLRSMQEMQRHAPELKALKEKYKDDKQRQQQEMMKFYQENKINPFGACLPLVLQIPVFISLFYMLRTDLKLDICGRQLREHFSSALGRTITHNSQIPNGVTTIHGAHGAVQHVKGLSEIGCNVVAPHSAKFLFLPDITEKATGTALIVLILLYVGSQLASTLMATAAADASQRRLMLILPIVFVFILYRYPAGLLVYWITTNLWTIGQQFLIKRRMPPPQTTAPVAESANGKLGDRVRAALAGGGAVAGAGAGGASDGGSGGGRSSGGGRAGGEPPRAATVPPAARRKKKKRSGRRR